MSKQPRLVFINGPTGVGKTTIAQRYATEHPLALILSADDFVGSMGQWLDNEAEARKLALRYIGMVAEEHLRSGYDVVVPYLLEHPEDMAVVEQAAAKSGARLIECVLMAPKEEVIRRAIERGTWGEPGAPPLTPDDRPVLEKLYDDFAQALASRPLAAKITVQTGGIDGTYRQLTEAVK